MRGRRFPTEFAERFKGGIHVLGMPVLASADVLRGVYAREANVAQVLLLGREADASAAPFIDESYLRVFFLPLTDSPSFESLRKPPPLEIAEQSRKMTPAGIIFPIRSLDRKQGFSTKRLFKDAVKDF